jgi:hypothetical protein
MNVFFDVHGTLVSGGRPRPHARAVFSRLVRAGHDVYLWSSAGPGYARRAARLLGVEDLVCGCYGKNGPVPVEVDFVVDDQPGFAGRHRAGLTVTPFDGDPGDEELWAVAEEVGRAGS